MVHGVHLEDLIQIQEMELLGEELLLVDLQEGLLEKMQIQVDQLVEAQDQVVQQEQVVQMMEVHQEDKTEIREVDNQEIRIKMDSNLEDPLIEIKEDKIMKETEIIHVLT